MIIPDCCNRCLPWSVLWCERKVSHAANSLSCNVRHGYTFSILSHAYTWCPSYADTRRLCTSSMCTLWMTQCPSPIIADSPDAMTWQAVFTRQWMRKSWMRQFAFCMRRWVRHLFWICVMASSASVSDILGQYPSRNIHKFAEGYAQGASDLACHLW